MDAEKLIEEAGRVSATRKWPMYLADLLHSLAAALRETTAREQATIASLRCAEGSLKGYAAANVAANKRIEALEHERDAARAALARLTTPRPIAEAPKDGTWIVGFWEDAPPKVIRRWAEQWRDYMGASVAWRGLTHFLPLPVLP